MMHKRMDIVSLWLFEKMRDFQRRIILFRLEKGMTIPSIESDDRYDRSVHNRHDRPPRGHRTSRGSR